MMNFFEKQNVCEMTPVLTAKKDNRSLPKETFILQRFISIIRDEVSEVDFDSFSLFFSSSQ